MPETLSVIIATRNRPDFLRRCLHSLVSQIRVPEETLIVDASDGLATAELVKECQHLSRLRLNYIRSDVRSAARQRNQGAYISTGSLVLFLDDDVILEPEFTEQIITVFEDDKAQKIGGVSGTITNQTYTDVRWLNRLLLRMCLGASDKEYPGRVVGPAINFLPRDIPRTVQAVEWLPSTCTAYRRHVFLEEQFPESYQGYSFAEDLHLSARVGKRYRLLNTTHARVFHEDFGKATHRDWAALGESIVLHRYEIMTQILNRGSLPMRLRLLLYEVFYHGLVVMREFAHTRNSHVLELQWGRLRGLARALGGNR